MKTKLVLFTDQEGSLTQVVDALRYDFPEIYQALEPNIEAAANPTKFAGSGVVDLASLQIELNLPPEHVKELDPLLKLLIEILGKYTKQQIQAKIFYNDPDGGEHEWEL